jgi:molybdopterin-binding protein
MPLACLRCSTATAHGVLGQWGDPLLRAESVTLEYPGAQGAVRATHEVSFQVHRGDRFVLLGPSGCGIACPAISCTGAIRRLAHVSAFGNDKEIIAGPVVSEVDVETAHGIVTSVITSRSIQDRGLKVGSEVIALVKSTEVSIAKVQ